MNNLQANICLLTVTLCWSCEIILHAIIPEGVNPFATSSVTFLIGALVLWAYFGRSVVRAFKKDKTLLVHRIVLLSLLNVAYNVLYLGGLDYFEVSSGAFTASMTVVILPVVLLAIRRGVTVRACVSALFVFAGIVLALYPEIETLNPEGFSIMAAGGVLRALFIVKLNDFAREHDPLALSLGISALGAVFSFIPWCAMQPATFLALPWSTELIAVYFIYGYFIVAFATVLNIFAQRRASAVHSTIIYSTEIIFSVIWAIFIPSEIVASPEITPHLVGGCLLVVLGNLWAIVPIKLNKMTLGHQEEVDEGEGEDAISEQALHPLKILLKRLHSPFARRLTLFAALLFVYLIISLPFKVLLLIPGFTDIRPVCMLQPVYGIFMGLPGCFAFALGNLIGDIASDSLRWSSIAGFVGNFAYPFLLYLFWTKIRKKLFRLRTMKAVVGLVASFVLCALVQTAIITPAVAFFYPEVDIALFAVSVFCNATLFPIAFSIPFMILLQEELGFVPIGSHNRFELGLSERLPRKLRSKKADSNE